ncbi:sulfate/molybdate ABC transporter ATP-binding protein [Glaciibacter sp. 2TAF33]|uniref:sulfate/molybdate ABC transporter ATP-binding protein n=1 Tax=Glaciibacter sp. 2TAF33 TaxID=3233015 RepID=UPI003F8E41A4
MQLSFAARSAARGFDVGLEIMAGETVAVLGPNGAGKSTLLGLIAGLVRPDAGRARLGDRVLFDRGPDRPDRWLAPHRRGVALLAQDALLFPHLSVRGNVAFGPRSAGNGRAAATATADHWLGEVDASDLARRRPDELSGGQAQRVAIARALAAEPGLLLLDEPLSALDVTATPTIRRMLRRVLAARTALIVTHDPLDAYLLADRVVVMDAGRIVEQGATRDVLDRPRVRFTADLAGVTLFHGLRTASGLVTDDGAEILAALGGPGVGERVAATLRPAAVRVSAPRGEGPGAPGDATADGAPDRSRAGRDGMNRLTATVRDLEASGDTVRVHTEWLSADVPPVLVADLDLVTGSRVVLSFAAADVTVYDARGGT